MMLGRLDARGRASIVAFVACLLATIGVAAYLDVLGPLAVVMAVAVAVASGLRSPVVAVVLYASLIPLEALLPSSAAGSTLRIAGVLVVVSWIASRPRPVFGVVPVWFWLFVAWTASSAMWSPDGLVPAVSLLLLFGVAVAIADITVDNGMRVWVWALGGLTTVTVGVSLAAIGSYLRTGFVTGRERFVAFEDQGLADFGALLTVSFLFLTWLVTSSHIKHRGLRAGVAIALPVVVLALLLTGTRSAWLAAVVGSTVLIWSNQRRLVPLVGVLAILLLGVLAVVPHGTSVSDAVQMRIEDASETGGSGRTEIWPAVIDVGLRQPVIGVGLNGFRYTEESLEVSRRFLPGSGTGVSTHSMFLRPFAETGLIGLVLGFLAVLSLFVPWPNAVPRPLIAQTAALVAFGAFHELYRSKYWWLMVGLFLGVRAHESIRARFPIDAEHWGPRWKGFEAQHGQRRS